MTAQELARDRLEGLQTHLEERGEHGLTSWEVEFIQSCGDRDVTYRFSDKQVIQIERIWEKVRDL